MGFISKDGICLILIHGRFPQQSFPANPTILDDESRWLSGRILLTNSEVSVLPLDYQPDFRYKEGTVRLDMREGGSVELPLSLFNKDDKKQIMSVPPKKLILSKEIQVALPIDEEKPKPVEPKKDDIE